MLTLVFNPWTGPTVPDAQCMTYVKQLIDQYKSDGRETFRVGGGADAQLLQVVGWRR
jgi:hypothetical protein